MNPVRTLRLGRDSLAELTPDDLRDVAAGAPSGITCPVYDCLTVVSDGPSCWDCITRSCW